jgi:flap endonuclease-1
MGILGLAKLLHERAPGSAKETEMKSYFGRRVAIDASMSIYQFVIAMRGFDNGESVELTNANGEVTTHLNGLWLRTLRMLDEGLRPVYVFDGAAPEMKRDELDQRRQKAQEAADDLAKAKEQGDEDAMEKLSTRAVRVSKAQMDECKKLLTLMGCPWVQAAGEAEAQCVELVKKGKCWAVATEDMDALTFGAPVLLRHLTFSNDAKKRPVMEYHIDTVLQRMGFTMAQFIDLCILLGCDYCNKIHGIGPQKAFEGIREHKTIEAYIKTLDTTKYEVPEPFPIDQVRALFTNPAVVPGETVEIVYKAPDEAGLRAFLVAEKLFNAERIDRGIEKLKTALQQKKQVRIDDFFKPAVSTPKPVAAAALANRVGGKRTANPSAGVGDPALKAHRVGNGAVKKAVKK